MSEVDSWADDYMSVRIDDMKLYRWSLAAAELDVTLDGRAGLLALRIARKAREGGATFRVEPQIWKSMDPVQVRVRANGTGLTREHVAAALEELTREAEEGARVLRAAGSPEPEPVVRAGVFPAGTVAGFRWFPVVRVFWDGELRRSYLPGGYGYVRSDWESAAREAIRLAGIERRGLCRG